MDAVEGRLGNMVSERRRLEQKLEEHRREEKEYMERMQEDQHALEKMQTKQSQLLKKVRGHSLRSNAVQNSRVTFHVFQPYFLHVAYIMIIMILLPFSL